MIVEEIEAEQFVARLLDDMVEGQYLAKDALVSTILSELLARQTTSNPIVLGGVDAGLDQVRSVDIRWDSLLRACLAVRDLVGGALFVESDKLNPRQRRLYFKERIGEDKGQQIRYRKNLKGIERESDFADLVTRLYAFGSGSGPGQVKLSMLLVEQEVAAKSWDALRLSHPGRQVFRLPGLGRGGRSPSRRGHSLQGWPGERRLGMEARGRCQDAAVPHSGL